MDRFSRRKTIYSLDFLSAAIYILMGIAVRFGLFRFWLLAVLTLVIGTINSTYMVAYESFYPMLITEGNFSRAYSIAGTLETLSAFMIPVSLFLYQQFGLAPLLLVNGLCFFIAALCETRIRDVEKERGLTAEKAYSMSEYWADAKEGVRYLWREKGLLCVTLYFVFSALAGGAVAVITLPYFRGAYPNGEYIYMLVWGMAIVGRAIGGIIQYRIKLPTRHKFKIALTVYIATCLLEGFYLYVGNIPLMMIMCFFNGILGVTSYTIRVSATQRYVPDERKGRFNGTFNMLNTTGSFFSELLAGVLTLVLDVRLVLCLFMMMNAAAAVFVIGGNAKHVAKIYNTEELPESEEQEQGS